MNCVHLLTWVLVTLAWVTQAHVYGRTVRTYLPPPEPCQPIPPCYSPSDDLSTVLAVSKLLDHDCTPKSNTNDINTGVIIDKLINALIYTTTHSVSGSGSNSGCNTGSSGGSGDRDGLIISLLKALLGSGGTGGSGAGGVSDGSNSSNGGGGSVNGGSGGKKSKGDQGLIDLGLLDRNDLLNLKIDNNDILRLGLGSQSTSDSKSSSGDGGALGGVSGVLDSVL